MGRKSKFILGLEEKRKSSDILRRNFTEEEKRFIIKDYLSSGKMKQEIWYKYTGKQEEHGSLLRWMRQLGYVQDIDSKRINFVSKYTSMNSGKKEEDSSVSFEILQLQKRITELENQLKEAEMKSIAFSTMVEIAEKRFNIPIRKKYNTKP